MAYLKTQMKVIVAKYKIRKGPIRWLQIDCINNNQIISTTVISRYNGPNSE